MTSHIRDPIATENTPSQTPHKKATDEVCFLLAHQHKMATTKDPNSDRLLLGLPQVLFIYILCN